VLRSDAPSGVAVSHTRAQEFALLRAAFAAGVTVPEPLWLGDRSVFGRDFFVMRKAAGTAAGHRIVKDMTLGGDRENLVERIGMEMARLHGIRPPRADLDFLPLPALAPALQGVREFRAFLDRHHTAFPALEWGLRWLERHAPQTPALVLTHRDFRTGNYMVDANGLTAVLDWEFAAWSDPLEDIGWFCARCWRFGQTGKEAGGIGSREALYRGYEAVSGAPLDRAAVFYWEVYAHVRWAVIALQQGERHVSGREPSLELALTAHIVPELEWQVLEMTGVANA
jgi:aminoglycoside phosphotransferase (APT) family kinase protein